MHPWVVAITLLVAGSAYAAEIPKATFLQFMKQNGPETLCTNNALLSCLAVTSDQCRASLVQPNLDCVINLDATFPDQLEESEENIRHYGSLYAMCLLEGWKEGEPILVTPMETCFGL